MRAVYYTRDLAQAELVCGFLREHGIDAQVDGHEPALYGWAITSLTTAVWVADEDVDRAEALIFKHAPDGEE